MRAQPVPMDGSYDELLYETVTDCFGFSSLRTEQDELIRASIEGHDVLGVLPTGGGKSACYQVPGIVTRSKTLVISPLIALQDDQVGALRARGVKAFAMHSGMAQTKRQAANFYFRYAKDEPAFLYVSPEMLLTETFHHQFDEAGFTRIAVDEAHCVSTWGNSFRPDYQRIRVAAQRLRIAQCSAFTATIDPRIERDIKKRLPLSPDYVRVSADPNRPNLLIKVERLRDGTESTRVSGSKKMARLLQLLAAESYRGPVIVYCSARDTATSLYLRLLKWAPWLASRGYSVHLFHAGLPYEDKEESLRSFLNRERPIVVATSAFGMGIDRGDVRQIVHYTTPRTLLDYAQQIGRAGRDGQTSLCTAFHTRSDLLEHEIKKLKYDLPTYDFVERVHDRLYAQVNKIPPAKRRAYNLRSFLNQQKILIEKNDLIEHKQRSITRVMTSVALLQRAGVITENGDGLSVSTIPPGGKAYERLVAQTEMLTRTQIRERGRLAEFFEAAEPDQSLLWKLLGEK